MFKTITADSFYGESSPNPLKELETPQPLDRRLTLKSRPVDLLNYDSRTWKVFERQDEALAFAKARGCGLQTFVFHSGGIGTRMFLVAHPREFWLSDQLKEANLRCSYEVIPEFTACKLYLDLEFDKRLNPESNGPNMVQTFVKILLARLRQLYGLTGVENLVLDLDSSTDYKFSRHVIFQNPVCNYANNYVVGMIVKGVCDQIRNWDEEMSKEFDVTSEEVQKLFVTNKHDKKVLFCDEGVYTKNRHFRLYGSTKPGRNAHLRVSEENTFSPPIADPKTKEEYIFLCSLITYNEPFIIDVPPYEYESAEGEGHCKKLFQWPKNEGGGGTCDKLPSPFPDLDKFVIKEMESEGIRSFVHFPSTHCIVYESRYPAYCGNIGRVHKSNKSKLVVNLNQLNFYRKCHDTDCRGYQSATKPLPNYLAVLLQHPEYSAEEKKELKEVLELLETVEDF